MLREGESVNLVSGWMKDEAIWEHLGGAQPVTLLMVPLLCAAVVLSLAFVAFKWSSKFVPSDAMHKLIQRL